MSARYQRRRTVSDNPGKTFLTGPQVAHRYGVADRSISRWEADPKLGFPRAMMINTRKFFALDELETWERSRAAPSHQKAA